MKNSLFLRYFNLTIQIICYLIYIELSGENNINYIRVQQDSKQYTVSRAI